MDQRYTVVISLELIHWAQSLLPSCAESSHVHFPRMVFSSFYAHIILFTNDAISESFYNLNRNYMSASYWIEYWTLSYWLINKKNKTAKNDNHINWSTSNFNLQKWTWDNSGQDAILRLWVWIYSLISLSMKFRAQGCIKFQDASRDTKK